MKKILLSVSSIFFVVAILAGTTGAFFSSQNASTGNTLATGIIDLKIDNESYVTNDDGVLVFSPSTSWGLSSLTGKLFFNFLDLKPGDVGEDTISLHVKNNKAWSCMNVKITATPEYGYSEPETLVDNTTTGNNGELQKHLHFIFWADDGDNVYEKSEKIFKRGLAKDIFDGKYWTLADSTGNIWTSYKNDPLLPEKTKYIGKAWCFGAMTETPVNQDNKGKTGNNGPLVRGTGVSCNGEAVGNSVQSDGIKADVTFIAVQSRNNSLFACIDQQGGGGGGGGGGHKPACSDGIDNNDSDTLVDAADPGCHTDGDPNNPNSYDPNDNDETDKPECSNGGDDDKDGKVDAADPGCHTDGNPNNPNSYDPNDDKEWNPMSGGGGGGGGHDDDDDDDDDHDDDDDDDDDKDDRDNNNDDHDYKEKNKR